ncbi:MAG: FAD-dependent oxidoreductase [Deltaproteobacteria bacterium]|nr:FAD-dependent oxidoreductase [Deltaproteobacteria bacterium]
MPYPFLFSPIRINHMHLTNRIVMTAMHLGYTPKGEVTDQLVEFYAERSRGGVGLIIVGGCPVDEYGGMAGMVSLNHDRFIPGLQKLTRAVKGGGARIAAQLYQAGRYTHSAMIGGRKPFSSSAVRSKLTGEIPRALELDEIPGVQDKFAEAAVRAINAGFDAVEILGSAGYLICQFLSPITNLRDDAYGGSLANRMRFGLEVVEKVRRAVGPDYPVIIRLAGNDFMEGGHTNKEARIFASELDKKGIDLFDITGGWHETRVPQLTMHVPQGAFRYLAQGIKSVVRAPVLASNRINDPSLGEEIIRQGEADMVTMARGLLADPYLPDKAVKGKANLIYHCVACNQGCFDRIFQLRPVTCLVNPRAGLEWNTKIAPAPRAKKVLVIGGGPAGMKAACTAAERGHKVLLVEKASGLGGQLLFNESIPGRKEIVRAARDLENNLRALPVEIRLSTEANVSFVESAAPDAVIIATGATPSVPDIAGIRNEKVVTAWDVLSGKKEVGRHVVIIGGNAVGLETALYLAQQGTISPEVLHFLVTTRAESMESIEPLLNKGNKNVTVVEMTGRAGQDIGSSTRWTVMAELKRLGVSVITSSKAVEMKEEGVILDRDGKRELLAADTVVIAAGSLSVNALAGELEDLVSEIHVVGDARNPRNALEATREGWLAGLKV